MHLLIRYKDLVFLCLRVANDDLAYPHQMTKVKQGKEVITII
jgi:hypothetical protein